MQIHFLSDVLIAVTSLDLKSPYYLTVCTPDKTGLDQRGFRTRVGLEKMVQPTNKLR